MAAIEPCSLGGQNINDVQLFKYLGSICSSDLSLIAEITHRLCCANHAFHRLAKLQVWTDPTLSRETKLIFYKVIVQSALLYACETWAITDKDASRLEVFSDEMLAQAFHLAQDLWAENGGQSQEL